MAKSLYVNIQKSIYFSQLPCIPVDDGQMMDFIYFHEGMGAFDYDDVIEEICKNYNLSGLALDALFIFLRLVKSYCQMVKSKKIHKSMGDNLNLFLVKNPSGSNGQEIIPECLQMISKNQTLMYYMEELIYEMVMTKETAGIDEIVLSLKNIAEEQTVKDHLAKEHIVEDPLLQLIQFIKSNSNLFLTFIGRVISETSSEVEKLVLVGDNVFKLFRKESLDATDKQLLEKFIIQNKNLVPTDLKNDDMINSYNKFHNNVNIFSKESGSYTICNFGGVSDLINLASIESYANKKLERIGMKIVLPPKPVWFHMICDCLIQQNIISCQEEALSILVNSLVAEKNTIGYTNKYDNITLFDHFTLICIANNMDTNYDKIIDVMTSTRRISHDFPIELLARIFSRVFNVIINLYLPDLTQNIIDNTIMEKDILFVNIYRYSDDYFFNIIQTTETFKPYGSNNQTTNDLNIHSNYDPKDILEI